MESLLGRQAVRDLDLEALEMAIRQRVLALAGSFLELWLNRDTSDYAALIWPVPAAARRATPAAARSACGACLAIWSWNGLTMIAPTAAGASARATDNWDWKIPRYHQPLLA